MLIFAQNLIEMTIRALRIECNISNYSIQTYAYNNFLNQFEPSVFDEYLDFEKS